MRRLLLAACALWLSACDSPEAHRTRGAGPGADTGNRGEVVRMHEGSLPFHSTPVLAPATGPVEPSEHAREFSG